MAQLIVRNLNEDLVWQLKLRAARHGRSMEAEHREILRQALQEPEPAKSLKELLLAMPAGGEDQDFERVVDNQGSAISIPSRAKVHEFA